MLSVSIITTCKGRLHHLMEALPSWLRQRYNGDVEVIVTDYQCPQGTKDVLAKTYPQVKCVEGYHPEGLFNPAHARNIAAWHAKGDILAFMDADSILLPEALLAGVTTMSRKATHLVVYKEAVNLFGSCFVKAERFHGARGYDESIEGYGYEDIDLYRRIEKQGVPLIPLSMDTIRRINHSDADRVEHYAQKTTDTNRANEQRCKDTSRVVNPLCYGYPQLGEVPAEGYGTDEIPLGE